MHIIFAALLAVSAIAPAPGLRTFVAHANGNVCAPRSICGWIKLGRSDMEATQVHNCVNMYESRSRLRMNGTGNPNLNFSETLVGISGAGQTFDIWGKWVNPTDKPQPIGEFLEVACTPGA